MIDKSDSFGCTKDRFNAVIKPHNTSLQVTIRVGFAQTLDYLKTCKPLIDLVQYNYAGS